MYMKNEGEPNTGQKRNERNEISAFLPYVIQNTCI